MLQRSSLIACSLVCTLLLASSGCQGESGTNGPTPSTNAPSGPLASATASGASTSSGAQTIAHAAPTAPVANDEPPQPAPAPPPATTAPQGNPGALAPNAMTVIVLPATGVTSAEDGRGAVVAAQDPVFLDVRGGVGGQALGPELAIGQLRFREHRYPSPGVVRFVCADKALLPRGAEVALVYGTKRTVVSSALVVP